MGRLVITIARGYGSGGRTMGRLLAEELGINYYDRELVRLASDQSGINEAMFGEVDERVKTNVFFPKVKRTYHGAGEGPESGNFASEENLFHLQAEVIKDLAQKEDCIIIGRCADYVLKDNPNSNLVSVGKILGLKASYVNTSIKQLKDQGKIYYKKYEGEWGIIE